MPARVILGRALESGWGQREIKHPDGRTSHNLFGVVVAHDEDGVAKKVTQPFRAYSSYEESFADYARLIGNSPRYETVAQARNEVEAARIQNSGYATDPQYAQKLIGIMNQLRGAPRIYAKTRRALNFDEFSPLSRYPHLQQRLQTGRCQHESV